MIVLFLALAGLNGQEQGYPATYENAVQCTGIIARIASTTGDRAAATELLARADNLASGASRLGYERGISTEQLQIDIRAANQGAAELIPTTSQAEWSEAMADVLPVARQCLALEATLSN